MRFAGLLIAAVLVATAVPGVDAVSSERLTSARRAAQWLVDRQQSNGAFFSATQPAEQTAATLAAVVAGGITGAPVTAALDYIRVNGEARATRAAATGRIIAGIIAGGADPRAFGGVDYVQILNTQYDQVSGAFEPGRFEFFSNVIAANGAVAGIGSLLPQAITYLREAECTDGGFSFDTECEFGPDLDTTALVVSLFVAVGLGSDGVVSRGRAFALTRQASDGGFTFDGFSSTSGDSTGLGLQLIAAIGEEAQLAPWEQEDGDDPVTALLSLQDDAGAYKFSSADADGNALSTVNAIPGMAGRPLPIRGVPTGPPPDEPTPVPTPGGAPGPGGGSAPDTTITSRDLVRTRDRTPTFVFTSNRADVRFECSIDGDIPVACVSPFTVVRLGQREHTFSVRAIDGAGNADTTPAADVFKVVKKRKR